MSREPARRTVGQTDNSDGDVRRTTIRHRHKEKALRSDNHFCRGSVCLLLAGNATFFSVFVSIPTKKLMVFSVFLIFIITVVLISVFAGHAGQSADDDQRFSRRARERTREQNVKSFGAGSAFLPGIGDGDELYPKHWNVMTPDRGSHPTHLQGTHSFL